MTDKKTSPALSTGLGKRSAPDAPRTVVCFGTPRGGTSMVAGAIAGLGVFMGPDLPTNVEDPMFNPDVDKALSMEQFTARLPGVIAERNSAHRIWGWKYPRANRYVEEILPMLRNPHLVLVYRDPVPATIRSKPEDDRAAFRELRRRLRMEMDNLQIAQRARCPTLMVSYERASKQPEAFIGQLASFLQLTPPDDLGPLLAFMEPGSYKPPVF